LTTADADHKWVSARAVAWVIHDAPVPAELAFTLTVIAARCDEHGCGSYQSVATIAALTGKSPKQAQRDIVRLRELGLVLLGDQSLVEHLPAGQRPTVYDVPLHVKGPKPVKESRNSAGGKKTAGATPPMDGTPPFHGSPGTHAGGDGVSAGRSRGDVVTPPTQGRGPLDGSPPMGGRSTPPAQGIPTPPMEGSQTTLLNNPMNNPSLSGPTGRIMTAVDATAEETRQIIEIIQRENRPRSLTPYVATLAANGDLAALLDRVRAGGRAAAGASTPTPPSYSELLARQPCPHGMPGGDAPRAETGTPACALCRHGPEAQGVPRAAIETAARNIR
jgi:hypothetical protein